MFAKCSTIVLALVLVNGVAPQCPADSALRGPLRLDTSDGVHTISVGEMRAQSEEVSFAAKKDGAFFIRLSGNASLEVGDLHASAHAIEASVPEIGHGNGKDGVLHLQLDGSVQIEIEGVRANTPHPEAETAPMTLRLTADQAKSIRLDMGSEEGVSPKASMIQLTGNAAVEIGKHHVTAEEIQWMWREDDCLRIQLLGGVLVETGKATLRTDRMELKLAPESSD